MYSNLIDRLFANINKIFRQKIERLKEKKRGRDSYQFINFFNKLHAFELRNNIMLYTIRECVVEHPLINEFAEMLKFPLTF